MTNLEQIKNDYIRDNYLASHDLDTWVAFQNYFASRHPEWFEQHWENICIIAQKQALQNASEKADKQCWVALKNDIKNAITNENNIIK